MALNTPGDPNYQEFNDRNNLTGRCDELSKSVDVLKIRDISEYNRKLTKELMLRNQRIMVENADIASQDGKYEDEEGQINDQHSDRTVYRMLISFNHNLFQSSGAHHWHATLSKLYHFNHYFRLFYRAPRGYAFFFGLTPCSFFYSINLILSIYSYWASLTLSRSPSI